MKELLHRATETLQWKKYGLTLLIVAAGVALMLLPGKSEDADKKQTMQNTEEFSLEATQARMEKILGRIEGTGKLQLMLTLKSGPRLRLAEDQDQTADREEMSRRTETVTVSRGGGSEDIVVTQQLYPVYQGALVVCQGADQAAVRLAVTEAVSALTGLSSDRITVVKWSS